MHAVNCFSFEAIMNLVVRDVPLREGIASAEFRNAMRHLTGGVSVITADGKPRLSEDDIQREQPRGVPGKPDPAK
jgi:hypothetical protein